MCCDTPGRYSSPLSTRSCLCCSHKLRPTRKPTVPSNRTMIVTKVRRRRVLIENGQCADSREQTIPPTNRRVKVSRRREAGGGGSAQFFVAQAIAHML